MSGTVIQKTVAIHQPNFFPWLGFFDKIVRSKTFILLDDVQFQKKGGTWTNRVGLLISSEPKWMTASVDRSYSGTRAINQMVFLAEAPWRAKMLKSIRSHYSHHPFFESCFTFFEELIMNSESNVASYNSASILALCTELGIDVSQVRKSSEIEVGEHTSNERLIRLIQAVGSNTYVCGGGASSYQDDSLFRKNGIEVVYQSFSHPVYPQQGSGSEFHQGLSIVDAVMNVGFDGVKEMLGVS